MSTLQCKAQGIFLVSVPSTFSVGFEHKLAQSFDGGTTSSVLVRLK